MSWEAALKARRCGGERPQNHTQKTQNLSDDHLAAAVAFKICEQVAVKEVAAAYEAMPKTNLIPLPLIKELNSLPVTTPAELRVWRDGWLAAIKNAHNSQPMEVTRGT